MLKWTQYNGHDSDIQGKKKKVDNTVYTFDIETTSYIILDGEQLGIDRYLGLTDKEQERSNFCACMYIWQFGINDTVYYGRTWAEFKAFLDRIEDNTPEHKYIFVHNLSFEFQFLRSHFKIKSVMSRKSRKVIRCDLEDYNITLQCTLNMSNVSLEQLSKVYSLPVSKMAGDLDYTKIRTPVTPVTETELKYCENDCLVLNEYIKMELSTYKRVDRIPPTSTGKVRKELQRIVLKDKKYRRIVNNAINIKPSVYNLMVHAFAGGYTHANFIYTDEVLKNVDSYDETSAYPYVMVSSKFPMDTFKPCNIKKIEEMLPHFAYLLRIKFNNIKCRYYNNFISQSKCLNIRGGYYDNGRIISAKEIEIALTDVDLRLINDTYNYDSYEILEAHYAMYRYLPLPFINFILDKYVAKTELKNVKGKEVEYQKEKNKFNSLYGMTVTNLIRDEVSYDNIHGWGERELTNDNIFDKLIEEKNKSFLSFAWGVWVTAYARDNLLRRVMDLDEKVVYCDTDSIKILPGYDKKVFEDYNSSVIAKIKHVANELKIPFERFGPYDIKGNQHILGLFEFETVNNRDHTYDEFITQGAKKYAVKRDGEIEITVSGVPKKGARCLTSLNQFRDNLVFDFKYTNKNMVIYNDIQKPFDLLDYTGIKYKVDDPTGVCLVPTTYELSKSLEYANLLTDNSSKRALFK